MIKMKCIGNEINGMQYYGEGTYGKVYKVEHFDG